MRKFEECERQDSCEVLGAAGTIPVKPLVAVAGGTGFVGSHLAKTKYLEETFKLRLLDRRYRTLNDSAGRSLEWKGCDLFLLNSVRESLRGCTAAVYLVHSMSPNSRLVQADFKDIDLLLADTFSRAAALEGVERIVYLGGLLPNDCENLSSHLASRKEVEDALRGHGAKVSVVRSGMVLGRGGSSFRMLANLVRRLPLMLFPKWTSRSTETSDVRDVCEAIRICLSEERFWEGTYDIVSHNSRSYRQLIKDVGETLGYRGRGLTLPINAFGLSKRWISWVSGTRMELVEPLIDSLRHDLKAKPNALQQRLEPRRKLRHSVVSSVDDFGVPLPLRRRVPPRELRRRIRRERKVVSLQRVTLPDSWDVDRLTWSYHLFLKKVSKGLIQVGDPKASSVAYRIKGSKWTLINLRRESNCGNRFVYKIFGGALARKSDEMGSLEFRVFPRKREALIYLSGFAPRLPWFAYAMTQARIHVMVMKSFRKHLDRQ